MSDTPSTERLSCQIKGCSLTLTRRMVEERDSHGMTIEDIGRALGWTVWHGTTRGGAESHIRLCPGHRDADAEGAISPDGLKVWGAECTTCFESERDMTKEDAEFWVEDHACDPSTRLIAPRPTAVGMTERSTA